MQYSKLGGAKLLLLLLFTLTACGQKGGLVLPNEAAAAHRATLPQSVLPSTKDAKDSNKP